MYFLAMTPVSTAWPRNCRLRLPVLPLLRWRLPARARLTLPLAVTLKRFLALLLVFIFGMALPPVGRQQQRNPRAPRRGSVVGPASGTCIVETISSRGHRV